jgi:hypothetical protein
MVVVELGAMVVLARSFTIDAFALDFRRGFLLASKVWCQDKGRERSDSTFR